MRVRGISVSFAFIVMLIISTGCLISDVDEDEVLTTPDSNRISQLSYEIHDPIIITSDADFEMQSVNEGWEGNGTETHPYIIENYSISSVQTCISINYTSVYFIISDCILECLSSADIIFLDNVQHARFEKVNCFPDDYSAVYVTDSEDIQFISCMLQGHLGFYRTNYIRIHGCPMDVSIDISNCDHCVFSKSRITYYFGIYSCLNTSIEDCIFEGDAGIRIEGSFSEWDLNFENNTFHGRPIGFYYNTNDEEIDCNTLGMVLVGYSNNLTLSNGNFLEGWAPVVIYQSFEIVVTKSTFRNCLYSIFLDESDSCIFSNNTFIDVKYAFGVYHSPNCEITDNDIWGTGSGSGGHALWVQTGSHNFLIMKNRISKFSYAIDMFGCAFGQITNNTINDNSIGMSLTGNNITVVSNHVYHNGGGIEFLDSSGARIWGNYIGWNSHSQAIDYDGTDMIWDDGSELGNYWSDYTGGGQYNISGTTNSVDRYPRPLIDDEPPIIFISQTPITVSSEDSVFISALIDDNFGINRVYFWYDYVTDGNYTMAKMGMNWTFTISPKASGTEISYRIYAQDWAGNWAVSNTYTYVVTLDDSTSISSTTSTSSTTSNPTTNTGLPTSNGGTLPFQIPEVLLIGITGVTVVFIIVAIVVRRR